MQINYDLIGRALIHPVQEAVLAVFATEYEKASPKELAERIDRPLATVSYHMRLLAGLSCGKQASPYAKKPLLRADGTAQRRGAIEHYYRLTKAAVV
jgi:hypothetical protein